mgnify:CR=1 FL=1
MTRKSGTLGSYDRERRTAEREWKGDATLPFMLSRLGFIFFFFFSYSYRTRLLGPWAGKFLGAPGIN